MQNSLEITIDLLIENPVELELSVEKSIYVNPVGLPFELPNRTGFQDSVLLVETIGQTIFNVFSVPVSAILLINHVDYVNWQYVNGTQIEIDTDFILELDDHIIFRKFN